MFEIKALAIADSYRMTCPVVRVTKMGEVEVEVGKELIKDVDHTICGPPCEELPMPDCIRALNEEFAAIFPAKIPGGMPPSRPTDHRIDLVQDHKIPDRSCTCCRRRRTRSCRSS